MQTLSRELRRELERAVQQARKIAEVGARKAIERLGVGDAEAPAGLNAAAKSLRLRLRAHGRQLGDRRDPRRQTQEIQRLVAECAYEHWHRMLFARFLAENDLLIEPDHRVAITLEECRELAREQTVDWLELASSYATRMLPQIFRQDDPVLDVQLPPESRSQLEDLLKGLPREVFLADDSLGWVYQFWQAERKDEVNKSETKIGADELPAVTQLFTEDYMVLFLLHNTLGAWWAGKKLTPQDLASAQSEEELRKKLALPGVNWEYLRFVRDFSLPSPSGRGAGGEGPWRLAAGTFSGWPQAARQITVMDPCMGSGHFLVFALPILVAMRMAEEGLSREDAVEAVLRENLFGLEIDPRCTQIAAFNLALAAWKMVGYRPLPPLNLACSGLSPSASEEEWLKLAEERGMDRRTKVLASSFILDNLRFLHKLFSQAPTLGSLIDPTRQEDGMFSVDFDTLMPYLQAALTAEKDEDTHERAVAAQGMVKAAELLAGRYTLVITNVPYLGRGKQDDILKKHLERHYAEGKADLATAFVMRCLGFCTDGGTTALVTPQNWLFLTSYKKLREKLLKEHTWHLVARLGEHAFESSAAAGAFAAMLVFSAAPPDEAAVMAGIDVSALSAPETKEATLREDLMVNVGQNGQLRNPDARIGLREPTNVPLLERYAVGLQGISPADFQHYGRFFWETTITNIWKFWQSTVDENLCYGGRELVLWWNDDLTEAIRLGQAYVRGQEAWGKSGVVVRQMRSLPASIYTGEYFDTNCAVIVPIEEQHLEAVWTYCSSMDFSESVRRIDKKLNVTNATLVKVPFDLAYWQKVAEEKYPHGLPEPQTNDPTQWLFHGHPAGMLAAGPAEKSPWGIADPVGADRHPSLICREPNLKDVLQVAVARLLGYRWPAEEEAPHPGPLPEGEGVNSMRLDIAQREWAKRCDELLPFADADGIVCLTPVKGEPSAADRLVQLLSAAFGPAWSAARLAQLLAEVGFAGQSLDDWLRDGFFEQHCKLFHQRPFIWHIWDGRRDGFHALVNYHRLAGANGEGRRTLEKLIYSYLGDWIERQRGEQQRGVEGADARLAAALSLKAELEKILQGEPPYDLFIRWKPLHEQPIGWEPDINDGVRLNIRPFLLAKDVGRKGAGLLRVKPNIQWGKDRGKEPERPKDQFPWFWSWDEESQDFAGGKEFDGKRWNGLHYTRAFKQAARKRTPATPNANSRSERSSQ